MTFTRASACAFSPCFRAQIVRAPFNHDGWRLLSLQHFRSRPRMDSRGHLSARFPVLVYTVAITPDSPGYLRKFHKGDEPD